MCPLLSAATMASVALSATARNRSSLSRRACSACLRASNSFCSWLLTSWICCALSENFRFHFSSACSQSLGDLDLLRSPENFRFHFSRARLQSLGDPALLTFLLLEADELRNVLDAVDDVGDLAVRPQDR